MTPALPPANCIASIPVAVHSSRWRTYHDNDPANLFVAGFIGSPPMNFLDFEGRLSQGARSVTIEDARISVPEVQENIGGAMVLGVRPEHVRFSDQSAYRGEVFGNQKATMAHAVPANAASAAGSRPASAGSRCGRR